ncbi:hypothetical protein T4B_1463 [Trichinella pseudospiralis]|uniref:Uncharacterized protein n=1 Tax=Trichinella pseudospiralis TaxID=6337 RepID=A0A0V1GT05_TRIPS|nr:hypothetical protein T4A_8178 [Trichinella pseudospiralis]KRZ01210.1 hypothetical protein T4B_1463 [Trichinella pseudospiralis]KRZ37983.1 hypothetical protein T4C_5495 [Trichinella pseudospiralis]KRZ44930.1 hypothetical protein T4C_4348 [Trichinella pseudospiralis]
MLQINAKQITAIIVIDWPVNNSKFPYILSKLKTKYFDQWFSNFSGLQPTTNRLIIHLPFRICQHKGAVRNRTEIVILKTTITESEFNCPSSNFR